MIARSYLTPSLHHSDEEISMLARHGFSSRSTLGLAVSVPFAISEEQLVSMAEKVISGNVDGEHNCEYCTHLLSQERSLASRSLQILPHQTRLSRHSANFCSVI